MVVLFVVWVPRDEMPVEEVDFAVNVNCSCSWFLFLLFPLWAYTEPLSPFFLAVEVVTISVGRLLSFFLALQLPFLCCLRCLLCFEVFSSCAFRFFVLVDDFLVDCFVSCYFLFLGPVLCLLSFLSAHHCMLSFVWLLGDLSGACLFGWCVRFLLLLVVPPWT